MTSMFLECAGIPPWAVPYFLQYVSKNAEQHGLSVGTANVSVSLELLSLSEVDIAGFKAWVQAGLDDPAMGFTSVELQS